MKQYLLVFGLLCVGICNAQSNTLQKNEPFEDVKISNFSVKVTVNSEKDLELLNVDEIASTFDAFETNEPTIFEIVCNHKSSSKEVISNFSIKIENKNHDKESFVKQINKAIQVTKKYFNQSKND